MTQVPCLTPRTLPTIDPDWKWITSKGTQVSPFGMATNHLFNTLRMIWNNSMPPRMRVGVVKLYRFDPAIYTSRYIAEAVANIGAELFGRDNLPSWMREQLTQMWRHLQHLELTPFIEDNRLAGFLFHYGE